MQTLPFFQKAIVSSPSLLKWLINKWIIIKYDKYGRYIPGQCKKKVCKCEDENGNIVGEKAKGKDCPVHGKNFCMKCKKDHGFENNQCRPCIKPQSLTVSSGNTYHREKCKCNIGFGR